jgi:hypothetical protein
MVAEHGQRLDERRGAGRQPLQPPFDLARDGVGPELVQPLRRRVGRRAPGRGERFDQRPEQERVAARHVVAPMTEAGGHGRAQPLPHQDRGCLAAQWCRSQRRPRGRLLDLREQDGIGRRFSAADRGDDQ